MHNLSIQVQVINLLYGCFARTEGIIHPAYIHNALKIICLFSGNLTLLNLKSKRQN